MITSDHLEHSEQLDVKTRARQSQGISNNAIYTMVARAIRQRQIDSGLLVDIGCGAGNLWRHVGGEAPMQEYGYSQFQSRLRYIGVDTVRYEGFPTEADFIAVDLNTGKVPLTDDLADVVCAVETIEHLENPRAFVRELVRLTKPGGWVMITTPNQLSLLSKITLLLKNQFNAFQEAPGLYPAHITALLETDLIRIFAESKLTNIKIDFTNQGRLPFTPWHWPKNLGFRGRAFSDNILCVGQKEFANLENDAETVLTRFPLYY